MAATAVADIGTYVITTTTTIPQLDPFTLLPRQLVTQYTITVVSDCTITTLTDKAITNMVYGVTLTGIS